MLSKYENWLRTVAKKSDGANYSDRTISKYTSSIVVIKKEFNLDFCHYNNYENLFEMRLDLFSNPSFVEKDTRGNRMYSRAVELFISFIFENEFINIQDDINKIQDDKFLSYDEKNSYIETICNLRNPQFQSNFRRELIKEFNCKCALCDINDKRLLIASHIVPYSECVNKADMYKAYNGLLLCVGHDALFDKHLISFDKIGNICIKTDLDPFLYSFLNINTDMKLEKKFLNLERQECLEKHMKKFEQ